MADAPIRLWKCRVDCHRASGRGKPLVMNFLLTAPNLNDAWDAAEYHAEMHAPTNARWSHFQVRSVTSVRLPFDLEGAPAWLT